MALSSLKQKLHDPIRKKWVEATPEEVIRQKLVREMVEKLGFPKALIGIERALKTLPHLKHLPKGEVPSRRADILAFARGIHEGYSLYPLLMIECKAVPITPAFVQQVVGYNDTVKAPYLAVSNGKDTLLGFFDPLYGHFTFKERFPTFHELIAQLQQTDTKM